jgi:serine/threonine protein kinase
VQAFLEVAIRMAGAVADIHRQGVIHKDLKPENIPFDPATMELKLADFGVATRIPREHQTATPPQLIEGTLPYMSPEQTGRMNRALDSRSDLYSLGVTLYRMLTGRLPFGARDPLEWVHCHVARVPRSPEQIVPDLPEPIAKIIMKLLAKMPEDRYLKLRHLPLETQQALELAASIGATVDSETLAIVFERDPEAALRPAFEAELLLRLERAHRFPHDRVQEAAYSLIPDVIDDESPKEGGRRCTSGSAGFSWRARRQGSATAGLRHRDRDR